MKSSETSHRTRSKAAPDWTVEEALTLATEMKSVESEWGSTLPCFQKWQQIVENCNALGVNRNLNQCKRKWDSLLSDYRLANDTGGTETPISSFTLNLYDAIDEFVSVKNNKFHVMGTDNDSDPEEETNHSISQLRVQTGSKKQRRRMKRKKRRVERLNPWGYFTSTIIKHEEPSSRVKEKPGIVNKNIAVSISDDIVKEQQMATILWEKAFEINTILETSLADVDGGNKLSDLRDAELVHTRCQGDKLIDYFTKFSATLNELCDIAQHCK